MSKIKLVYAMKKHIIHLVLVEKKPCCVLDFLDFEVGGEHYSMARGTFGVISVLVCRKCIKKFRDNNIQETETGKRGWAQ